LGGQKTKPAMSALSGPVEFLFITGNYLLFWPVYRLLHPKKTQRRRALLDLFLIELAIYIFVTGLLVLALYKVPDFHHGGFLLAELVYLLLLIIFWIATYGVWSDSSPDTGP
jgi:hypothetical protein